MTYIHQLCKVLSIPCLFYVAQIIICGMKKDYLRYCNFIEKPEIKKLNNAELLKELPFYDHLSIVKNKTGFTGYARRHKIEVVQKIDVITQLKPGEINIKDLFKDLLNELKGFKYQINLKILLGKIENMVKLNILQFVLIL